MAAIVRDSSGRPFHQPPVPIAFAQLVCCARSPPMKYTPPTSGAIRCARLEPAAPPSTPSSTPPRARHPPVARPACGQLIGVDGRPIRGSNKRHERHEEHRSSSSASTRADSSGSRTSSGNNDSHSDTRSIMRNVIGERFLGVP
jgi:hypothetical protein